MYHFSKPPERGIHPESGLAVFGFTVNDVFIHDPYRSECGRFSVQPEEAYGIAPDDAAQLIALNIAVFEATLEALDAGCAAVQAALGIKTGDVAGVFFSGPDNALPVSQAIVDYAAHELALASKS